MKTQKLLKILTLQGLFLFSMQISFAQNTCSNAISLSQSQMYDCDTTYILNDTIAWFKFTADTTDFLWSVSTNNASADSMISHIKQIDIYEGSGCGNLILIYNNSYPYDDSASYYMDFISNLSINQDYYIRIENYGLHSGCSICPGSSSELNVCVNRVRDFSGICPRGCPDNLNGNEIANGEFFRTINCQYSNDRPFCIHPNTCVECWQTAWGTPQTNQPMNLVGNSHAWMWSWRNNSLNPVESGEAIQQQNLNLQPNTNYFYSFNAYLDYNASSNLIEGPELTLSILNNPLNFNCFASPNFNFVNLIPANQQIIRQIPDFIFPTFTNFAGCFNLSSVGNNPTLLVYHRVLNSDPGNVYAIAYVGIDDIYIAPLLEMATMVNLNCPGEVTLGPECPIDHPQVTYLWSNGATTPNITVTLSTTTSYTVTVSYSPTNCTQTATVVVNVNSVPEPDPIIAGSVAACVGGNYNVTNINQNGNYIWTTYDNLNGTGNVLGNGGGTSTNITWPDPYGYGSIVFTMIWGNCIKESILNIYPCCEANLTGGDIDISNMTASDYLLQNNTYISMGWTPPINSGPFLIINGTFTVDIDFQIEFSNVLLGPDARIDVEPGYSLNIRTSWLHTCGSYMWDHIFISDNTSLLNISGSFIEEADNAIISHDGGIFRITSTTFNRNNRSIVIEQYNQPHTGNIQSSVIKCTDDVFANPGTPALMVLPPFANRRSFTGVQTSGVSYIKIGEEVHVGTPPTNHFYNLDFGIICDESNMDVLNNIFEEITDPAPFVKPAIGSAIIATGGATLNNFINVGGADVFGQIQRSNHFQTCHRGVQIVRESHVLIDNNTFDLITGFAGLIENNPARTMILRDNEIFNSANGFRFSGIPNPVNSVVERNLMTLSTTSINNFTGVGISVNNPINTVCALPIRENEIHDAGTGIYAINSRGLQIFDNHPISFALLTSSTVTQLHNGIWLQNCRDVRIANNLITRTTNPAAAEELLLVGINIENCVNNIIDDNSMVRMGSGIRVRNTCSLTQFHCNSMTRCYRGTDLSNATLPTQGTTGFPNMAWDNMWVQTLGPWKVRGSIAQNLDWYYQGAPLNVFDPAPYFVTGFFNPSASPYPNCSNWLLGGGGDPDYDRDADFGAAVADSSSYAEYEEEHKYYEKQLAYSVLKDSTDLLTLGLPTDPDFQDFYDDMEAGNIGALEAAKDATLAEDYQLAWQKLGLVADTSIMESNMKMVNEIYLDFLQSGADTLTAMQEATLTDIAYLPSLTNGEGVFMARGILGLMVDVQVSSSARMANNEFSYPSWTKVRIWPNPATNEITVTFDKPLNEDDNFILYDQRGKIIYSNVLSKNKFQFILNVENLNAGIYFGKLMSNGDFIFEKIVIVK